MLKRTQHISRPIIEEDIGDRVLVKWFFFCSGSSRFKATASHLVFELIDCDGKQLILKKVIISFSFFSIRKSLKR